jgi:head-to-tail connecting protein
VKPSKDFSTRYTAANKWRDGIERDLKDVLRFCANGREKDFEPQGRGEEQDPSDIYISFAEEMATDLAGDFVTYFTPAEARWAEFVVTSAVPQDMADAVEGLVNEREDEIFSLIEASNYYDVAPQIFFEAATHGTPAMWVEQSHLTQPIYVETVPPHELLITPGHNGHLDRFRERKIQAQHLAATFAGQDMDFSDRALAKKMKTPGETVTVCWGFWLDWSDPAVPMWKQEVTVDGKRVSKENETIGPLAGSCPLQVGRFNPQVGQPWGRGSARKALADIFTGDTISELVLSSLDAALKPVHVYPDDGTLDMSDGLEAGAAYPAGRGFDGRSIQQLQLGGNLDYGWFSEERIEERLRVAFYQDGPRQRGDTPPSATQWVDEARKVQRRVGKPSAPLWSEMLYPFIQRVEYIAVQTGRIPESITQAGDKLSISPISPLQKAQNQDKVLTTRSNLDTAFQIFGDAAGQAINAQETMKNIKDASGDELLVLSEDQGGNAPQPPDVMAQNAPTA